MLAAARNLTDQQLGRALVGICEQAFENDTGYVPDTRHEEAFFNLLTQWLGEAKSSCAQHKKRSRNAAQARWQKNRVSDGASSIRPWHCTAACQPEPEPEKKDRKLSKDRKTLTALTAQVQDAPALPAETALAQMQAFAQAQGV